MADSPVIFLSFSNSQDAHLHLLKRESDNIKKALEPLDDNQAIKIEREESADVDKIFHVFNRFNDRICIFHYAGHANGSSLELEKGGGYAEGLGNAFSSLSNLKLVFLNGCSTKGQVDYLMEKGVKAVIATEVPISDLKATEFAEYFYRSLANKSTIKRAFTYAADYLTTKYGATEPVTIIEDHRGFSFDLDDEPTDPMPWGLYLKKESAEEILDWTLPMHQTSKAVRPPEEQQEEYEVNKYIYWIADFMIESNPKFEERLTDENGDEIDDRKLFALIIGNYPWMIGSQLRRLVSRDADMNSVTLRRVEQLINTYVIASKLLYYILLSQIWKEISTGKLEPSSSYLDALSLTEDNYLDFDFISRMKQLMNELKSKNISFFIEEYEGIYNALNDKGDFFDAYLYLESLKNRLSHANNATNIQNELWNLCADAEYALHIVLGKSAFLINYQMLTVRDIVISNPRHSDATFKHNMGNLKAQDNDFLSLYKEPKTYDLFVDSRSVILVKDLDNIQDYLTISPFVIDKNAFGDAKSTSTDLFVYAFTEGKNYMFYSIRHNVLKDQILEGDKIHSGLEEKSEVEVKKRSRMRSRTRAGKSKAAAKANRPYALLDKQFQAFEQEVGE